MKCPKGNQFPYAVRHGSVTVKIYRSRSAKGYDSFYVAHHVEGKRKLQSFANWDDAYENAKGLALKLAAGEIQVSQLTPGDRISYGRALTELEGSGIPLEVAAKEYAQILTILGSRTPPIEAARYYVSRHQDCTPKNVAEAVEEMLTSKKQENASKEYVRVLGFYLRKFSKAFSGPIGAVSTSEIADFLRNMRVSNRSKKNYRAALSGLFGFCKERAWVSRQEDPMEHVPIFRAEARDVTIYTPEEIVTLLSHSRSELIPYLTIGAFAGLRSAELQRLDWSDIDLSGGVITVRATKAKTGSRRAFKISENLKAWLTPYSQKTGRVLPFVNLPNQLIWLAEDAGLKWKRNALRHSFCSYRLAIVQDSGKVAYEAGNSSSIIYKHYHELVRPADAKRWFAIEQCHGFPSVTAEVLSRPEKATEDLAKAA